MQRFEEVQQFRQWWLWLLMGGSAMVVVVPFLLQLTSGNPVGSKPAPTVVLGLVTALMVGLCYLLWSLKLKTNIDSAAVRYDYGVFGKKTISWTAVSNAEVLDYGFVGYGVRLTRKYGTVYNVAGKWGLFLTLKSGKKITIGTQQKETLEQFMKNHKADLPVSIT